MTVHELASWRAKRGKADVDEDYTEKPDPPEVEQHDVDLLYSGGSAHPVAWRCSCGDGGTFDGRE